MSRESSSLKAEVSRPVTSSAASFLAKLLHPAVSSSPHHRVEPVEGAQRVDVRFDGGHPGGQRLPAAKLCAIGVQLGVQVEGLAVQLLQSGGQARPGRL